MLTFHGPFALATAFRPTTGGLVTAYHLQRCGTALNLAIPFNLYYRTPLNEFAPPVASSRAVIWTRPSDGALVGRFLPSLQRFVIRLPATPTIRPSQPATHGVAPTALTRRTIYISTITGNQLWAAALPAPTR